jgi:uncharacterized protein YecE (DUF72 family)
VCPPLLPTVAVVSSLPVDPAPTDAEPSKPRVLIGTQGFGYDGWNGLVYPPGLRPGDRLATYAQAFPVVELDRTFYGLPRQSEVARWVGETPETFRFTAKVPRLATHDLRLQGRDAIVQVEGLVAALAPLGERLGAILFQMGPGFRFPRDAEALYATIDALPDTVAKATRVAFEFRHPSWLDAIELEDRLSEANVAWVWNDWSTGPNPWAPMPRAIDEPRAFRRTADFAYVRLTGDHDLDINFREIIIDRGADLRKWAALIRQWQDGQVQRGRGGEAFVFLNNHYSGSSPRSASDLREALGLAPITFATDAPPPAPTSPLGALKLPGF